MISQIEHVARAFYDAANDGQLWDNAPNTVKDEFRLYARDAIALHDQLQQRKLAETDGTSPADLSKAA
jgi:hypothetical protein